MVTTSEQKFIKEQHSGAATLRTPETLGDCPQTPRSGLKQHFEHVFRMNRKPMDTSEKIHEGDYVNASARTVDKTAATADQKFLSYTQTFPPMAACWLTLLVITALRIYFTSVMSENNGELMAENQQLKKQNQQLKKQNQQLKTQRNNLTEETQDMEIEWNELNVSRAQWSIDTYCLKNEGRQCRPCQRGWHYFQPSCYVIYGPIPAYQKTWAEARENCKGRNSDLAIIVDQEEKTFLREVSISSSGTDGYWIGLRAERGKWKWTDGSDLNEASWVPPPTDGHCAISVEDAGWKSVSCNERNRWFCEQKALSV